MEGSTKKLYEALTSNGYEDLGSFADFEGKLKDSGKRELLYGRLKEDGFEDVGSLSDFNSKLGYPDNAAEDSKGFLDYAGDVGKRIGAGVMNVIKNAAGSTDKLSSLYNKAKDLEVNGTKVGDAFIHSLPLGPLSKPVIGALDAISTPEKVKPGIYKDVANKAQEVEEGLIQSSDYYEGKDFKDLWKEGKPGSAVGEVFLKASESLPQSLAAMFGGGTGLVATGVLATNQKYDQLDQENPDLDETQKVVNAVLTGSFEALSEKLGDVPIGKWLKSAYSKMGKQAAEETIQKGVSGWLQSQFKDYGVFLAPVAEGAEEIASQLAENITDKVTGVDPSKNITDGLLESFVYGAGGGAQFSIMGLPPTVMRQYNKIKTRRDYNTAKSDFLEKFKDNPEIESLFNDIVSAPAEEQVQFLEALNSSNKYTDNQKQSLIGLINADIEYKARRSPEAIQEDKVARKEMAVQTEMINHDNANAPYIAENGMIQQVFINGDMEHPVCIIKGDVISGSNVDGEMVFDPIKSSNTLYYRDNEGKMQVVSPGQISGIANIVSADDNRAQYEASVRGTLDMQEQLAEKQHFQEEEQEINNGDDVVYIDPDTGQQIKGRVLDKVPDADYIYIETKDGEVSVPKTLVSKSTIQSVKELDTNVSAKEEQSPIETEYAIPSASVQIEAANPEPSGGLAAVFPIEEKSGEIDYDAITEPLMYADALVSEFEDDAMNILDKKIQNAQKIFDSAGKMKEAIKGARAAKKAKAEIKRFEEVRDILLSKQKTDKTLVDEAQNETLLRAEQNNLIDNVSEEDYRNSQIESGSDPVELAGLYNREMDKAGYESLFPWQQQLIGRKINKVSFERFGDKNKVSGTIARSWFNPKSEETANGSIDAMAEELSEYGIPVTTEDIIEFIYDHPSNRIKKGNDITRRINERFKLIVKDLTGEDVGGINSNSAKLVLAGIEAGKRSAEEQASLPFQGATIPDALLNFIDATGIDLESFDSFEDFNNFVEQELTDGTFDFPLSEQDYSQIKTIINHGIEQQRDWQAFTGRIEKAGSRRETQPAIFEERAEERSGNELLPIDVGEEIGEFDQIENDPVLERPVQEVVSEAEQQVDTNPTEAQKEAGNYRKGHVKINGFDITIEQPAGSVRSGRDSSGKEWSVTMNNTYGYIRGTEGVDGDHIDVFLGPNLESQNVFVVDQVNSDGTFDEHKVMIGFDSQVEASDAYLSNYKEGWLGLGSITVVSLDKFKRWIDSSHRKTKPFSEYKSAATYDAGESQKDQSVSEVSLFPNPNMAIQKQIEWGDAIDHVSLIPVDQKVEKARKNNGYNSSSLREGLTFMERELAEKGGLSFMGSELTGASRILSSQDVAFLFKNLESAATENSFLVMIRPDGAYGVYYSSTGGTSSTLVDLKLLVAAAKEYGANKVCFVHNHPSGMLRASAPDINVHKKLRKIMANSGIETMNSIVINLDSGKYLQFDEKDKYVKEKDNDPKDVITPKIYQFDKSVFYKPSSERTVIRNSDDIAQFLSKQKRGITPKLSALVLDHGNNINKYVFLDPAISKEELVSTLIYEAGKHGNNIVLSSNAEISRFTLKFIQESLSAADVTLLDVLEIRQNEDIINNYKSYANEGVMEADVKYDQIDKDDNSKSDRIEKLRNSKPIEITGEEYIGKYELNRTSVQKWILDNLRGKDYIIKDTGETVRIEKLGAKKVTSHSMGSEAFLKTISEIPRIIENGIFIDELSSGKDDAKFESYKYYVCGLTVGGVDYTVKITVGVKDGNCYYDHSLTEIEKGSLINELNAQPKHESDNQEALLIHKDKKLLSILQVGNTRNVEIISEVNDLSDSLNTPIHLISNIEEIKDENRGIQNKKRGSKGWYDPETDEIYLVLPNAESVADAQATVLHESVGHKGLRGLLGNNFSSVMDSVFDSLPIEVQESLLSEFGDKVVSAEEYCAHMAETMSDPGIIQKICSSIKEAFRRIGVNLRMTDGDIMYMLWKSKNRLQEKDTSFDVMSKVNKNQIVRDQAKDYDVLFRSKKPLDQLNLPAGKKEELKAKIQSRAELLHEAYVDRMIAVKKLQNLISEKTGKPIPDYMNVYMYENTLSSRNTYEQEQFKIKRVNPMVSAMKRLTREGLTDRQIENYVIAKHGLERNEKMRLDELIEAINELKDDSVRDHLLSQIEGKSFSEIDFVDDESIEDLRIRLSGKDYSGLTAIQKELKEQSLLDFIKEVEAQHKSGTEELWRRIRAVNEYSLKKWFDSGMINSKTYDRIKNMYEHYIPLRGFDEAVAHDVYDYYTESDIPYNNPLKTAKGRTSRAESPFPYMMSMGNSSIVAGNKNQMKLHLYRMAQSGDAEELSVSRQWFIYKGVDENGVENWEPSYPEYAEDLEEYRANIEHHEADMIRLQTEGKASSRKDKLKIGLRISPKEANEHIVEVKLNGEGFLILVHGNPKVAQAVNGENSPEKDQGKLVKSIGWANRQMAANFTTRNPAFVFSNLSRDLIWSSATLGVKEGAKYRNHFLKNIPKASKALLNRIKAGESWKADPNDPISIMLDEFLKNGARTGYTALYSIDKYKQQIEDSIKNDKWSKTKRGYNAVLDFIQLPNEWAEDLSRFATYMTSRQEGRSILQSVSNAKEVTVNFNRKGSGAKGAVAFRSLFLFFNAAVQSLNNAYGLTRNNPKAMTLTLGGFAMAGMVIPTILSMLGDDEDREKYNGLPDYVRKNNFCIPLGFIGVDGFLKIPLPIELRAFYGIGDAIYRAIQGEDNWTDAISDSFLSLTDLLPLNPAGGTSNFIPDAFKPVVESYITNEDFTGKPIAKITPFNEYDPEYQRVYRSASVIPVKTSEFLNMVTGGDDAKRGWYDDILGRVPTKVNLSNPASLEHLFESYLGGTFTTLNQTFKTFVGAPTGMNEFSWRTVPVLNRFYDTGEVDGTMMKVNEKYFDYLKEMKESQHVFRKYEKLVDNSPSLESAKYIQKLDNFEKSDDWKRAEFIAEYSEQIRDLEEELKEMTDDAKASYLKSEISTLKKNMVESLKNGKAPD